MSKKKTFKILFYGLERLGYEIPSDFDISGNISISFEPVDSKEKFSNYDGVIMFQGIWAYEKTSQTLYGPQYYLEGKLEGELHKRFKELQTLLKNGGFVCYLLSALDRTSFDLAQHVLSRMGSLSYEPTKEISVLSAKYGELQNYIDAYGVARTKFHYWGDGRYRSLVRFAEYKGDVGISMHDQMFFLPCHAPDTDKDSVGDLSKILSSAIVSLFKKLNQEVPGWAGRFRFKGEGEKLRKRKDLLGKLDAVDEELEVFDGYKGVLAYSGDRLREAVINLLDKGLGFELSTVDNFKEDLSIVRKIKGKAEVKELAVVEIKGVNGNVSRASINQVDSHRERGGHGEEFPGILLVNTFIKSSNSISEKDRPVNMDQIRHARKQRILVMRTLDILRALDLVIGQKSNFKVLKEYFFKESGWLEVKDGEFVLHGK